MKPKHGLPLALGNMRELGVQRLVASCLNYACQSDWQAVAMS